MNINSCPSKSCRKLKLFAILSQIKFRGIQSVGFCDDLVAKNQTHRKENSWTLESCTRNLISAHEKFKRNCNSEFRKLPAKKYYQRKNDVFPVKTNELPHILAHKQLYNHNGNLSSESIESMLRMSQRLTDHSH